MAYAAARPAGVPSAVRVTLGSVVTFCDEYGLVWHATRDVLRVLPIRTGRASVALSLANEIATHLPNSLGGWGVVCEEVVSWPRTCCDVLGEYLREPPPQGSGGSKVGCARAVTGAR